MDGQLSTCEKEFIIKCLTENKVNTQNIHFITNLFHFRSMLFVAT